MGIITTEKWVCDLCGNRKIIYDWEKIIYDGGEVIPKTSGRLWVLLDKQENTIKTVICGYCLKKIKEAEERQNG